MLTRAAIYILHFDNFVFLAKSHADQLLSEMLRTQSRYPTKQNRDASATITAASSACAKQRIRIVESQVSNSSSSRIFRTMRLVSFRRRVQQVSKEEFSKNRRRCQRQERKTEIMGLSTLPESVIEKEFLAAEILISGKSITERLVVYLQNPMKQ